MGRKAKSGGDVVVQAAVVAAPKRRAAKAKAQQTADMFGGTPLARAAGKAAQVAPAPKASPPRPPVAVLQPCTVNAIALVCAVRELSVLGPVKVRLSSPGQNTLAIEASTGAARVRITLRWEVTGFLAAPWVGSYPALVKALGALPRKGTTGKASLLSHGGKLAIGIDGRESVVLEGDAAAWTEADGCGRTAGKGRIELSSLELEWPLAYAVQPTVVTANRTAGVVSILGNRVAGQDTGGRNVHVATLGRSPFGASEGATWDASAVRAVIELFNLFHHANSQSIAWERIPGGSRISWRLDTGECCVELREGACQRELFTADDNRGVAAEIIVAGGIARAIAESDAPAVLVTFDGSVARVGGQSFEAEGNNPMGAFAVGVSRNAFAAAIDMPGERVRFGVAKAEQTTAPVTVSQDGAVRRATYLAPVAVAGEHDAGPVARKGSLRMPATEAARMARIEAGFETLAAAVRMQGEQMLGGLRSADGASEERSRQALGGCASRPSASAVCALLPSSTGENECSDKGSYATSVAR